MLPSSTCGYVQLREKLDAETVNVIGEEFVLDGLFSDPILSEEANLSHEEGITSETISSMKEVTNKLLEDNAKVSKRKLCSHN